MAKFHLLNFGCRASQADGAALKKQMLEAGFQEAARPGESQVALLNTCTVTARADAEVRQVIRRLHREHPQCRILVTGCYAQRAAQEIAALDGVGWVVGNSHKHTVAALLSEAFGTAPPSVPPPASPATAEASPRVLVGEISEEFHFAPTFAADRTRPTLKVQDGCDARCAFCVIPAVRGASRSLAPERVVAEVEALVQAGAQEIVLSGINLGSYGRDLGRHITFLGLLEKILAETSVSRLRISSIEPMDVTPQLIRLAASEPRLARHFHVPLQRGSDHILRAMNRRYWTRHYAQRVLAIREQLPDAALGADVMVGFPGETAQDHAASLRFIESLPFTYLHIFPFSARPGTPAAARPGQVNGRIARERSSELRAALAPKRRAFLEAQVGRRLSALTLDEQEEGSRVALSSNYLKILLPEASVAPNQLLEVAIGRVHGDLLYGYKAPR